MREFTIGEHSSMFHGTGFDYVGLREWQAGDRFEHIDWPQSSLNNFSPLIVREFEQPTTSSVILVADRSASTRCGADTAGGERRGLQIATLIARSIATVGMSAVFFQDSIGLITFDEGVPRAGRGASAHRQGPGDPLRRGLPERLRSPGDSQRRQPQRHAHRLLAQDSDDAGGLGFPVRRCAAFLKELSQVNNVHDVFIMMVDASFAFELPRVSAGWIEVYDVETGQTRMMSRRELSRQSERVRAWQDEVARQAKDNDLDVIRLSLDQVQFDVALVEWVAERRLRRRK